MHNLIENIFIILPIKSLEKIYAAKLSQYGALHVSIYYLIFL